MNALSEGDKRLELESSAFAAALSSEVPGASALDE